MTERLTNEQLEAIRKRADTATTAPWIVENGEYSGANWLVAYTGADVDGMEYYVTTDSVRGSELEGDSKSDAEFIAHAREDVPKLLAEIVRLRSKELDYRRMLIRVKDEHLRLGSDIDRDIFSLLYGGR